MRHDLETADLYAFSSTMTAYSDSRAFLSRCVLLALLVASCASEVCDKSKCPGPLGHYNNIQCKPIYKNPDDCCAEAYDCSHLEKMSKDKCYVNGHEYSIGEKLRDEDALPCDNGPVCTGGEDGGAAYFHYSKGTECPEEPTEKNCYIRRSLDTCCSTTRVCLEEGEVKATCEVDGHVYNDGDFFTPHSNPQLDCVCLPGYTGENVEPFCKMPNRQFCDARFNDPMQIHNKCAPVYDRTEFVHIGCTTESRCASDNDVVVHGHDGKSESVTDDSKVCKLGNLTMHIGDTLNEGNTPDSVCVKCKCEVPPIPTCMHEENCDATKVATTPSP
ncbi:uncharacterized protein LOC143354094 isoform X2 [Halictus rubicundus]|uniref:uncharacterized protein LOC143354094 isoform X2 n=1 Tax=Halictus rubicundus TaxID=77578 RepID=UPI004035A7C9